jgi:hypothetical protein
MEDELTLIQVSLHDFVLFSVNYYHNYSILKCRRVMVYGGAPINCHIFTPLVYQLELHCKLDLILVTTKNLCTICIGWATGRNLVAPLLVYIFRSGHFALHENSEFSFQKKGTNEFE